ncbi:MAG: tRNA lysidine(34) synthetase TilS [Clostridiaceae bacterium]|jgi:tRNA(Ile)-lysidine synthase|nr:tRNA lysidine(34) synthetase TilS [Clostridiaceae bacterium]
MVDLIQNVELFLKKYKLEQQKNILVAFSGGVDSMCLADILAKLSSKYKFKITLIHLNHNWRGVESKQEEENAKHFAKSKNIEFYSETLPIDTPHTETAARELRYEFFENCANKFDSSIVLTAHNANDNAETILYRITKGTGIIGLCGIQEHRDIYYRPLLNVKRADIEQYAIENNLNPNHDSSNENTKYKRNLIRKDILPEMKKINPDIIDTVNSLITNAINDNKIIDEYLSGIKLKIKKDNSYITKAFTNLSSEIQDRLVYDIFQDYKLDYDRKTIEKIRDFINTNQDAKNGKTTSLNNNLWIFVNSDKIEVIKKEIPLSINLKITKTGKYELPNKIFEIAECSDMQTKFPKDSDNIAYVNLSNTKINFELRTREDGDIIRPLGCLGMQKLKKYINSKKIPKHERDNLLLLANGKEILWVIGLGISEKIKVEKTPTHVLKLYDK